MIAVLPCSRNREALQPWAPRMLLFVFAFEFKSEKWEFHEFFWNQTLHNSIINMFLWNCCNRIEINIHLKSMKQSTFRFWHFIIGPLYMFITKSIVKTIYFHMYIIWLNVWYALKKYSIKQFSNAIKWAGFLLANYTF